MALYKQPARHIQDCQSVRAWRNQSFTRSTFSCLLFLLLSGKLALPHAGESTPANRTLPSEATGPATTTIDSEIELVSGSRQKSAPSKLGRGNKKCEYNQGRWTDCELDGSQLKVVRLKTGSQNECKTTKTLRRDCKIGGDEVGCKYARGQWSSTCEAGQRVRIDTLVAIVDGANTIELKQNEPAASKPAAAKCKTRRRVTKECGRTCHYVKSAWSECINGQKTRMLILEPSERAKSSSINAEAVAKLESNNDQIRAREPGDSDQTVCAPQKLISRECIGEDAATATTAAPSSKRRQPQELQLQKRPLGANEQAAARQASGRQRANSKSQLAWIPSPESTRENGQTLDTANKVTTSGRSQSSGASLAVARGPVVARKRRTASLASVGQSKQRVRRR